MLFTHLQNVKHRVATGNRIVPINKVVVFPIYNFRYIKKNTIPFYFFFFFFFLLLLFDRCRVFDDDFSPYSKLAETRN